MSEAAEAGGARSEAGKFLLGVDIGGTFTDLVAYRPATGSVITAKVLTTPDDPSRGALNGIDLMSTRDTIRLDDVALLIHGTTLAANALIQRTGAPTALLTTNGFRDVLAIARERHPDVYDSSLTVPEPLVPREHRLEVVERTSATGDIVASPDADEIASVVGRAIEQSGVVSLAVAFLHSYANPTNERYAAAVLADAHPQLFVSLSSDVAPEIREFERTSTAVTNAYLQPLLRHYLERLKEELTRRGYQSPLFVMLSSGGVTTSGTAALHPVRVVESGPAGGVGAALYFGRSRSDELLAFDMGGTTAKLCLITQGHLPIVAESEVARIDAQRPGSGFPLLAPTVDLVEIGTGGGSIAAIDQFGLLKVGPLSAGAQPGPACYGLGGSLPTTTDADLLLGYLDASYFVGGEMPLHRAFAEAAVARLAATLDIDLLDAAVAIHEIANETMANAAKSEAAKRGLNIRAFTLVATGGAGPVHAYGIARRLGIQQIVYPPFAGVISSLGFLVSPIAFEASRSYETPLESCDFERVKSIVEDLERQTTGIVIDAGVRPELITTRLLCEISYQGQGYETEVVLSRDAVMSGDGDAIRRAFEDEYFRLYAQKLEDHEVKLLTWRVRATEPQPEIVVEPVRSAFTSEPKGVRELWVTDVGMEPASVYERSGLAPGTTLEGPLVIEEKESTVVIPATASVTVEDDSSIIVRLKQRE
jgi:N-methylhydantoinase A/oxoprolinase/acetone carboxylase beta subunit